MAVTPYTLNDAKALKAPAPLWRFVVLMPALSNTNSIDGSLSSGAEGYAPSNGPRSVFSSYHSPISVLLEDIEVPQLNIQSNSRLFSARNINFPGRLSINSFSAVFYETENYDVTDYLTLWRNNVVNDAGNFGLPSDYKKSLNIYVFSSTGVNTASFKLSGVYPESISGYNYSSGSSDRLRVNCSFSADFSNFYNGFISSAESSLASSTLGKKVVQVKTSVENMFA